MISLDQKFTVSQPTVKLLSSNNYRPTELMYLCPWDEKYKQFMSFSGYTGFGQTLARAAGITFFCINRKNDQFYTYLELDGSWFYSEYNKTDGELHIDCGIPQSAALAMQGRKVGEMISGIKLLSDEKIKSVSTDGNSTKIILSTSWLRLKREPRERDPSCGFSAKTIG